MSSSVTEVRVAQAEQVRVTAEELIVDLVDGRTLTVPVQWYPRLANGTPAERRKWRFIGRGEGIHWPELDEDIGVEDLLAGRPSGESQTSLQRWLKSRGRVANKRMQPPRRKPRVRVGSRSARG
ncbi:MAG: hypothetical protein A2Z07_01410 [Armatimonadetes bacterium RBG_16_67_12]|nr:MAG: hypothetical protein A2Z07_01410 [Armatimonadetes bacterium RBG_16_67_12]